MASRAERPTANTTSKEGSRSSGRSIGRPTPYPALSRSRPVRRHASRIADRAGGIEPPGIAEHERLSHPRSPLPPMREAIEVDEIGNDRHPFGRDARGHETLPRQLADGHVTADRSKAEREFLPGNPSMAGVDGQGLRKVKSRRGGFEMMLAVNDVRRLGQAGQVVDDRDAGRMQVVGDRAESGAAGDGRVSPTPQGQGDVPDIEFASATVAQRIVGQKNPQDAPRTGGVRDPPRMWAQAGFRVSIFGLTAGRNGSEASRRRKPPAALRPRRRTLRSGKALDPVPPAPSTPGV